MELLEPIRNMGLDEKEARIYLTLLQLKKATAYYVALKSGLKRTTTYATLDTLVDKGFVLKIPDEKKELYMAK
jgi:sugar-specific transcriptional regulator TrmB